MTIAELFNACNAASIRLSNIDGKIELRGSCISNEIIAAVKEHKNELIGLLTPALTPTEPANLRTCELKECEAIAWEGSLTGAEAQAVAAKAIWDWNDFYGLGCMICESKGVCNYCGFGKSYDPQERGREMLSIAWNRIKANA